MLLQSEIYRSIILRSSWVFILMLSVIFSMETAVAQPTTDLILIEHSSEEGQRMMWLIASHPDGRIASINYAPDATAGTAKTLAADHILLLDMMKVYDLKAKDYRSDALDAFERVFGKRIRREWGPSQNWQLLELVRDNHRQRIQVGTANLRLTVLNRIRGENLKEYADFMQHIDSYKGATNANLPAPHADQIVHFLIGEYGYEAVEFDRKKWQEGRIDTVYVQRESKFSTLGFGFSEKVLLYTFLGILLILLAMVAWLLTRFAQFKKEAVRSMNHANRQLKNIDEMQLSKDDTDNLLRLVHLMIKYRQHDSELEDHEIMNRLKGNRN